MTVKPPSSKLTHLLIINDAPKAALIRTHELGLTIGTKVCLRGDKLTSKYPVDSNYFSKIKLKIKFDGDDYVFGETIIGLEDLMQETFTDNENNIIMIIMIKCLGSIFLPFLADVSEGINYF